MKTFILLSAAFILPVQAIAQDDSSANIEYKSVTTIDMGEIDLKAPILRPSLTQISETRSLQFNPLIQLRSDFHPEMLSSVNEIK
jgi:hypothetical protein